MNTLYTVALVLLVVGGINWGLVGLFDFNLVSAVLGEMTMLSKLVYILVGVSALYVASVSLMKNDKM